MYYILALINCHFRFCQGLVNHVFFKYKKQSLSIDILFGVCMSDAFGIIQFNNTKKYPPRTEVFLNEDTFEHTRKFDKLIDMYVFTNPSARTGCDTGLHEEDVIGSIFKRSLTGLGSELSHHKLDA